MITDEQKADFKSLFDHFNKEDEAVRFRQIRQWRKLKLYWDGLQRIWYSEVAHDWRVWDNVGAQGDDQSVYYDKPINVFRAYLESIIAALSINIPAVTCFPEDATNPADITTAKAGDKIARLVYRHNEAILFWLRSLYIYATEGLIGCYAYSKEDEKFGTYKEDQFDTTEEERLVCPNCEEILPDNVFEVEPTVDELTGEEVPPVYACPECNEELDPNLERQKTEVKRLIGTITKPKSRQCLEVYGGLYIKVPNYAMKQSDCPYLIWEYETHFSNVISRYPDLAKRFQGNVAGLTGISDPYERWGRQPTPYIAEEARNTITVRNCWFRPSSYYILNEDKCEELKKKYPKGLKVVYANDEFCEATSESMDDCWTLSRNPLSDYIHHDPMGSLLVSIQDITNDMISLILQTIEHGIPQTFADPAVLDFDAYKQSESTPGMVYPTKPQPAGTDI